MSGNIQAPRGTQDILPAQSGDWQWIEARIRGQCALYGMREIRTPIFEHTELFQRGVGDTTDVVQKQMYTFEDKSGRSLTLRPEGTAGVVRALIQHNLPGTGLPLKLYYMPASIFRYETPQHGRYREHRQFGLEIFGAADASADAELIEFAMRLFRDFGITGLTLHINSIGCKACREAYHAKLKEYYGARLGDMCSTCRERFERNPLRILDCKEERCKRLTQDAPSMIEHLCPDCAAHFEALQAYLGDHGLDYVVDPRIVRGLDYYTRTVFEIIMSTDEGELTVCGGGRYDALVEELGGPPTPAAGFGMGMERLLMVLESLKPKPEPVYQAVVLTMGAQARSAGVGLVDELRSLGVRADIDHGARSLKAGFKWADRTGAAWVVVIAQDELDSGAYTLRCMADGEQRAVPAAEIAGVIAAAARGNGDVGARGTV